MTSDRAARIADSECPTAPSIGGAAPRLGATPALLRALPHLPAFWPGAATIPLTGDAPDVAMEWLAEGAAAGGGRMPLRFAEGPFPAPAFGSRWAPPILFAAAGIGRDPLGALLGDALARGVASPSARARAAALRGLITEARLGGACGLPDPGPRALHCGTGDAIIVLDPCDPARRAAARRLLLRAASRADGRPLRVLRAPDAPHGASPTLDGTIPDRIAPWTLLDAAAELHVLDDGLGLLGLLAGIPVHCDPAASYAPWAAGGSRDGLDLFATVASLARCADPFRRCPSGFEEALALLADWRCREAENRRIAVCVGMSFWKRARIGAAFASSRGEPAFLRGAGAAIAEARSRGGGIAVWASQAPRALAARADAAGVPVLRVEDGFIRSAGLGAGFLPAASLTLDGRAPYYDPSVETDLERLLATTAFPPALLARAAALIDALRARRVTKYNLGGGMPSLPESGGRRRILVPGQVADDLSVLRGAVGAVRGDRDLLQAARAAEPDAFLIYKPHPDVVAGHRRGGLPAAEALRSADLVVTDAPMAALLEAVDGVHTLTSLTGFEALLRDRAVTVWGQPFYAGWGLTHDMVPIPRRKRQLAIAELVAGALILYPRYIDPVTELPCTPELLLERLGDPALWRPGAVMRLRHWQGRARGAVRRFLAGRGAA